MPTVSGSEHDAELGMIADAMDAMQNGLSDAEVDQWIMPAEWCEHMQEPVGVAEEELLKLGLPAGCSRVTRLAELQPEMGAVARTICKAEMLACQRQRAKLRARAARASPARNPYGPQPDVKVPTPKQASPVSHLSLSQPSSSSSSSARQPAPAD